MEFYLIIVLLFIIDLTDKTLSVDCNLCAKNGKLRQTFDEIFGQKWENEKKKENETDQNLNYERNKLIDLNDQLDDHQKCKIIHKFHVIKERINMTRKNSSKFRTKIEQKIAEKLGINRTKIYEWKNEFGINKTNFYEKKKQEFINRVDEFKRMSDKGKQKQFAKELGISERTFIKWKKEFGIEIGKKGNVYSNEAKTAKMNFYYKKKKENPSISDKEIAEFLKIGKRTLSKWKNLKNS